MTTKIKKINEIEIIDEQDLSIQDYVVGVDFESGEARRITLSQVASLYEETGQFISRLGEPEDGSYEDGLFTDFTEETTLGVAMDRVNEVLKGLAPLAPPILSNLESPSLGSNNAYLSFGVGNGINYQPVTAIQPPTLSSVGVGANFANASLPQGGGGAVRLGVYTALTPIVLILNNKTVADSAGSIQNYPNDCFSVSSDGIGTFILEINGVEYSPSVQTQDTASLNQAPFNLGAATPGHFLASGLEFAYFKNRVGTVEIPTTQWRLGHNYVKVSQVSSLSPTPQTTNYVDWVYDPDAASGINNFSFGAGPTIANFSIAGSKYLSGIQYYTNASYDLNISVANYYKNVYSSSGITISNKSQTELATSIPSIPAPSSPSDNLSLTIGHSINTGRTLNQRLSSRVNASNGLGKTLLSDLKETGTILLDNKNDADTLLQEKFCSETYRVALGSYDDQTSLENAGWNKQTHLADGNLAVFDGSLVSAKQTINNGNIRSSGINHMPTSPLQPDYSTFVNSNESSYIRKFQNTLSPSLQNFFITLTGTIDFIENNISFPSSAHNKIKVFLKIPGTTGWRDCVLLAPASISNSTADNIGARSGTITNGKIGITLVSQGMTLNQYFALKIVSTNLFNGKISNINVTLN